MNKIIIILQSVILTAAIIIAVECGIIAGATQANATTASEPQQEEAIASDEGSSYFIDGETIYFNASDAQPNATYFINGEEIHFN